MLNKHDENDIQSLGWASIPNQPFLLFELCEPKKNWNLKMEEDNRIQIYQDRDSHLRFMGWLQDIDELKVLMRQLRIF